MFDLCACVNMERGARCTAVCEGVGPSCARVFVYVEYRKMAMPGYVHVCVCTCNVT